MSCSSSGLPSGNTAPLTTALLQNCNPGFASSCNAPNDSDDEPECDREARNTAAFYVYLKAQNYGQGGIPNCAGVTVCDSPSYHLVYQTTFAILTDARFLGGTCDQMRGG